MKKLTYGTPEKITPQKYCINFNYREEEISYPIEQIAFEVNSRGCLLRLPIEPTEQIYGLGLQLKQFNLRNKKVRNCPNADPCVANGDSHAPVPFFVSTKGYGMYIDTARYAEFYFGSSDFLRENNYVNKSTIAISTNDLYTRKTSGKSHISIQIPVAQGVDVYIIEGKCITEIVAKYNNLSGGGCETSEWALEPIYRCFARYTQKQVLEIAKEFYDKNIKIKTIGLEPGWQSGAYPCTFVWNKENFPEPDKLIGDLKNLGMHINLWEHAFTHKDSPIYDDLIEYSGDYSVWNGCVPDFATNEARKIFSEYHKNIVKMGIDGFKMDECDGSDITGAWSFPNHAKFPSGMDGEQYHSMFGSLYMQTMLEALGDIKVLSEVRNAGALCAPYPFVLYSDLYAHKDFIRGLATAGFSGLLWTPEVRDATSKEDFIRRLQTNVFSVQCLINAWYCKEAPWKIWNCEDEVKYWLDVRQNLVPILKDAFERYKKTGIPPVRALVSDYTDDPETYNIDDQYVFCDDYIVAPMCEGEKERRVYLPCGRWQDYFTGKIHEGGWHIAVTEKIPVYIKIKE